MNPKIISLICLLLIFLSTTLGSAFVFFFKKKMSNKVTSLILGFAGGIMISSAFFGLLLPSINESKETLTNFSFIPPIVGFLLGCIFLYILDKIVPHLHKHTGIEEGPKVDISKNLRFFLAVIIHNIPEGLSVGFACGLAIRGNTESLVLAALSLAIGISIQNIPEGAAISIPMYSDGIKRNKAFIFGSLSGIVEPIFGVLGLFLTQFLGIVPWLLAFAAGAMFYVTLDEIMPESREGGYAHYGLWAFIVGFLLMMALEIVL